MLEILSQNQIDELLSGINSGEVEVGSDEKRIREYDFKTPRKFTKEQLKTLGRLHENLSRLISSYLSGALRVFCEVSVLQIEEQRYYEYSNALPDNAMIGMMEMKPANENFDEATLILNMSTSVGFLIIDRFLGGSGEGYDMDRDFSDIELAILENVLKKISRYMQEAWNNYIDVKIDFTSIETNPRMVQTQSPEDIVVIVALNVKVKNLTGTISICIPSMNLEEMIESFSSRYIKSAKKLDVDKDAVRKQVILGSVKNSGLEMKAVLHEFQVDLQDILQLQVGDVIPLNKRVNSDIYLMVDNIPWFEAKLGETKLRKAVKINKLL